MIQQQQNENGSIRFKSLKEKKEHENEIYKKYKKNSKRIRVLPRQGDDDDTEFKRKTLVESFLKQKKENPDFDKQYELEEKRREEEYLVKNIEGDRAPLVGLQERAHNIKYTERLKTSWRPPRKIRELKPEKVEKIRKNWKIDIDGDDCPAPLKSFKKMRFPPPLLKALKMKGIEKPTPIQMQGLPIVLSGRDMVGIAFTGSGKTLVFALPMILFSLEQELNSPLDGSSLNRGPLSIVLCPSRELARQTFEVISHFSDICYQNGLPKVNPVLLTGGTPMSLPSKTIHMIVATPGRLLHMLNSKIIQLSQCYFLTIDEGDRMIDLDNDEEMRDLFSYFGHQRQTVLFSATMPPKIQDFAKSALVDPICVNVGRAGAANLDVVQEVEYVKEDAKIVYLLECLQKTAPPVLIFCSSKDLVDDIHEYLLLKGVEAVAIHGGLEQGERNTAISLFKQGEKDVLVATDVASKGLDFPDIRHVINYNMPSNIEDYVHRIGRTGRCGKTGIATTFINRTSNETTLLDLKHLLMEAKQKIPPVLESIEDPFAISTSDLGAAVEGIDGVGCVYCGGLGHRVVDCPKLESDQKKSSHFYDSKITGY